MLNEQSKIKSMRVVFPFPSVPKFIPLFSICEKNFPKENRKINKN
jgi:hypothetical protein